MQIFKHKSVTIFIFTLFIIISLLYLFNVIAMHYIIGIVSLLLLLLLTILSANEIIEVPKKQLFCLILSLFIIAIVFITHFIVAEKPFTYQYEQTNSGIEITGYKKRVLNNYGDFYIEIPSHIKGEKVTKIKERAFLGSKDLLKLTIPDTVLVIEKEAFCSSNLRYVILSKNVNAIYERAFSNTQIDYITIPSSVEYIGSDAFSSTDIIALEMNTVHHNWDQNWCNKSSRIYYNSVGVKQDSGVVYILYNDFTSAVVDIAKFSHSMIEILEKITFDNKEYVVNTIESNAGYNTTFEEIVIPDSIVKICYNAIKNENLKNIFIPKSVLYIEEKAFVGCNNLTISTEHLEKPLTWDENWNFENKEVKWNVSLSE